MDENNSTALLRPSVFSERNKDLPSEDVDYIIEDDYSFYGTADNTRKQSPERVIRNIAIGSMITMAAEAGIAIAALVQAQNANRVLSSVGLSSLVARQKIRLPANIAGWLAVTAVQGTYAMAVAVLRLYINRPELFHPFGRNK